MYRNFKSIGKRHCFPLFLPAMLCIACSVNAQQPAVVARMLFPPRNYEIQLGDTVTPSVRVVNAGSVSSTSTKIFYRITNIVTDKSVYYDSITLPSLAAGDSIDRVFVPYVTNANILQQLGTFNACLIVAGDTICARVFGMRRTTVPFFDPSNNYSHTVTGDIPDQTLWVSVGAQVVDGENSTWDPPPPRNPAGGYGPDSMISPVMRLDRKDISGNFYSGSDAGDTLTSFPINMQGKTRADLSFDYMRGGKHAYPLNWDSDTMFGPESTILDETGKIIRAGDSLILEFKKPSEPAVNPSANGWDEIAAIDGGRDFEFKSCYARSYDTNSWLTTVDGITKTINGTPNYFTSDFRFRFRLKASNDAPHSPPPLDDADPWYIDNPLLTIPLLPDVEVSWVRVVTPFTKVPLSQAIFPVKVGLFNNTDVPINPAAFFNVQIVDPRGDTVYSYTAELATLPGGSDTVLQFPSWDASGEYGTSTGAFTAFASLQPGYQSNQSITQTYTKFFLNVGAPNDIQEFALDDAGLAPAPGAGNDIPKLLKIPGVGIGFLNTSGSIAMKFQLARRDTLYGARLYFGSANASPDYIRISLYNGDSNSCTPLDTVAQPGIPSSLEAQRGGSYFDQFWPYYFPQPIILEKGIYWLSVSQLSLDNMELGAGIARGGEQIVSTSKVNPRIDAIYGSSAPGQPWYGTQWGSSPDDNNGAVNCSFAIETPAASGLWKPLMPGDGWWSAMTSSDNLQPILNNIMMSLDAQPWTGAGTYVPMIRPIFGNAVPPSGVSAAAPFSPGILLGPNYPNPFDPTATSTTISFALPEESQVSITISNIMGDIIKTLVNSTMTAGTHSVSWDGRDENGAFVPAGAYLISLESAGRRAAAKMIVTE